MERLQKVLAQRGIASRRKAEQLILAGKVKVNGKLVTRLGTKVDPETAVIQVAGELLPAQPKLVYYLLNKPCGYVTTAKDQFQRKTVLDLIDEKQARVYPVGRLDYETEGLLLLTNDGELTYQLTHPSHQVDKVYQVLVEGKPSKQTLQKLAGGVRLTDGLTAPAQVKVLQEWPHQTLLELTIREGRNRQVRRMLAAVGHPVKHLKRTKLGCLSLDNLPVGQYRSLTPAEINQLKNLTRGGSYGKKGAVGKRIDPNIHGKRQR